MNSGLRFRLSVMMFLEFFIWGAWLPPSFGYFGKGGLGFTDSQQEMLNLSFPVASILGMFLSGFVDRTFAAERFLAVSQFIGGLAMLIFGLMGRAFFADGGEGSPEFWPYFACMAVHCLCYVPTISVTNAIAFANLKDPQKDFGPVRLWGTIGWIAAAWPFIFLLVDWKQVPSMQDAGGFVGWLGKALGAGLEGNELNVGKSYAFIVAGVASLGLAAFSMVLPHTPPKPATSAGNKSALLEAAALFKNPYVVILFVVAFIDATVHDGFFFFAFTYLQKVGVKSNWIQPAMSVGQIAEIATMAFLALVLKKLGWRFTMIIGVLGHAARFAVFALLPYPACAVAINVLHGVCYAFFFATLYIFVDAYFPKDARTSAQSLFNLAIVGLGPIASRLIWQRLQTQFTTSQMIDGKATDVVNYGQLLLFPCFSAIAAAAILLIAFHPPVKPPDEVAGH